MCGEHPTITKLIDYHQFCGVPNPQQAAPAQETKVNEGEIDVTEVKRKMDRGDDFVLIDVREPHEYQDLPASPARRLIPLGEFPKRVGELDPHADIVIHCKSGMRSAKACGILRQAGFTQRPQHEGRHPGLERQGGPQRAEVLTRGLPQRRRRAPSVERAFGLPCRQSCGHSSSPTLRGYI